MLKNEDLERATKILRKAYTDSSVTFHANLMFTPEIVKKSIGIPFLIKICLFFIKARYKINKVECIKIKYKIFKGKTYILDIYTMPPQGYNCRCTLFPKPINFKR